MLGLSVAVVVSLAFAGCAPNAAPPGEETVPPEEEEAILMKYSTIWVPALSGYELLSEEMGPMISEATDGRVKYEFYGEGRLYSAPDAQIALAAGDLEMTDGGPYLAPTSPDWDLLINMPFLFDDQAHLYRFFETDAFQAMKDRQEAKGILCLTDPVYYDSMNVFTSIKPVRELADLRGMKLRISPYPMLLEWAEAVGMEGISIPFLEAATALETGIVDGALDVVIQIEVLGTDELCPYLTIANVGMPCFNFVVSKEWWDSLPTDLQEPLEDVLNEAIQKRGEYFAADRSRLTTQYTNRPGNSVYHLPKAERDSWVKLTEPIRERKMAESEELREMIEAIDAVR